MYEYTVKSNQNGNQLVIDHFTVVFLVTWPLSGSEAAVDLAMIQTLELFRCKFSHSA